MDPLLFRYVNHASLPRAIIAGAVESEEHLGGNARSAARAATAGLERRRHGAVQHHVCEATTEIWVERVDAWSS